MEPTKHFLYDNWLYYKMETWEIRSLLKNRELLIKFTKLLDISGDQVEEIYYKRDCLLFELHRRSFRNCIVQLYSVCKVKRWLTEVDNARRCDCCNLEYYEFSADLLRIERGVQQCSVATANLLANKAFAGGRSLGFKCIDSVPVIPSVPALPSASSSSASNAAPAVHIPYSHNYLDTTHSIPSSFPDAGPLHSHSSSSSSGFRSRSSEGGEGLLERPEGVIAPIYIPRSILKSSRPDYSMFEYKTKNQSQKVSKNRFIQALPFPKRRRRYVTFNLRGNGNNPIQYNYEESHAGEPSSSADNSVREHNVEQFTSRPGWSFAKKFFKQN